MDEQDNINLVKQMYADFGEGNIPAVLESMADDVVWKQPTDGPAPFAGTIRGREQLATWFGQIDTVSDVEAFDIHDFFTKGNKVVALGSYIYQSKATGKTWESDWAMVWTIKDGKIAQGQIIEDTLAQANAMRSD